MDEKTLLDKMKAIRERTSFQRFDACSILAKRGEWSLIRWCYATDVAKRECAYWLKRSPYRGEWDIMRIGEITNGRENILAERKEKSR